MSKAPVQDTWEILVDAPAADVWAVLDDSANLPRWCPFMVKDTTGGKESMGATRECTIENGGRSGRVKERCIDYQPERRIMWTMDEDTLGITRMLEGFAFGFSLERLEDQRTRVTFEQRWRARTLLAKLLVPLVMRRQMAKTNERLLGYLKQYVEGATDQERKNH